MSDRISIGGHKTYINIIYHFLRFFHPQIGYKAETNSTASVYRNRTDIGVSSGEETASTAGERENRKAVSTAANRQIVCFREGAHLKLHSQSAKSQQEGRKRQPCPARQRQHRQLV